MKTPKSIANIKTRKIYVRQVLSNPTYYGARPDPEGWIKLLQVQNIGLKTIDNMLHSGEIEEQRVPNRNRWHSLFRKIFP